MLDEAFLLQERKPLRHISCLRLPEILHCGRHDSKQSVDSILQKICINMSDVVYEEIIRSDRLTAVKGLAASINAAFPDHKLARLCGTIRSK